MEVFNFSELESEGVLVLMSDSTNSEWTGVTKSEGKAIYVKNGMNE